VEVVQQFVQAFAPVFLAERQQEVAADMVDEVVGRRGRSDIASNTVGLHPRDRSRKCHSYPTSTDMQNCCTDTHSVAIDFHCLHRLNFAI